MGQSPLLTVLRAAIISLRSVRSLPRGCLPCSDAQRLLGAFTKQLLMGNLSPPGSAGEHAMGSRIGSPGSLSGEPEGLEEAVCSPPQPEEGGGHSDARSEKGQKLSRVCGILSTGGSSTS